MYDYHIYAIVAIFIILDIISGMMKGIAENALSSTKMRVGLVHKSGFILAMLLSAICEYAMNYIDLGFTLPLVATVAIFVCLTEIISIVENLKVINPELDNHKFLSIFGDD